jgi:hypothetical protein
MPKLKLQLILTVCLVLPVTGCSQQATATDTSPTQGAPTAVVDKVLSQAATPAATAAAQPTTPPTPASTGTAVDTKNILKGVPDKIAALQSYRIKGIVTGGSDSQQDGVLQMDVIAPDKAHMSLPSFEFYSIGTTSYYKFGPNASWMKGAQYSKGVNPLGVTVLDPRQMIANAVAAAGSNPGQPVDLNGMPMLLYQYTATPSDPNSSSGSLWVGIDDGLPYKLVDVEQDGTNVELNYYDFNANFKIDPPIP